MAKLTNKISISLALLIFLFVSMNILAQESQKADKIAFANFLTIYHSYSQTKLEDARLKEKGLKLQEKIDMGKNKITELENKMNSGILSEEEKGKLNEEIEALKTELNKQIQESKLEIASDERQTIERLIEELRVKISNYGKEKGYLMIFDKNSLIFSDIKLDLTEEIVDYINKDNDASRSGL